MKLNLTLFARDISPNQASSKSLYNALEHYIPPNVWKRLDKSVLAQNFADSVDVREYIQVLFEKSIVDMRRYGSSQQLAQNLETYRRFPGYHLVLGEDPCSPINSCFCVYQNSENNSFLFKQDIYEHLQKMIMIKMKAIRPDSFYHPGVVILLSVYLKSKAAKLASCCDFVPIDQQFQIIENQLNMSLLTMDLDANEFATQLAADKIVTKLEDIIPDWKEEYRSSVEEALEKMVKPPEKFFSKDVLFNSGIFFTSQKVFQIVEQIINANPKMFLPTTNPDFICLRVFIDDDKNEFVMAEELKPLLAKNLITKETSRVLQTISKEHVPSVIDQHIRRTIPIEYIKIPILRSKYSAVPIRTPEGYCKLATDVLLLDLLPDMIFGSKVFQRIKTSEWSDVEQFFEKLQHHFDPQEQFIYFIRTSEYAKDEEMRNNYFSKYMNRPVKQNRNAKADGFTAQNLRNELMHLNLHELFPEITSFADVVYEHVDKVKTTPVLRTSDLFDAIEHCILPCVFSRLPKLAKFLHNQTGCKRIFATLCCNAPSSIPSELQAKPTKWKSIGLNDVQLNSNYGGKGGFNLNIPMMICPDGQKLFYNETALYILLRKLFGGDEKQIRAFLEDFPRTPNCKLFILNQREVEWFVEECSKNKTQNPVLLAKMAFEVIKNLESFFLQYKQKVIYLRTFNVEPIDKEFGRAFFEEEFFEALPIICRQNGKIAEEKLALDYNKPMNAIFLTPLKDMRCLLEKWNIEEPLIHLVPDIMDCFNLFYHLPPKSASATDMLYPPCRKNLIDMRPTLFKIFREVVCDVNWKIEVGVDSDCPNVVFRDHILQAMKSFHFADSCVDMILIESVITKLKQLSNYVERKKRHMLTPFMKLYDCEFNDTVSLRFFLTECVESGVCERMPSGPTVEDLEECRIPAWRARLFFFNVWSAIFFQNEPQCAAMERVIRMGIYNRTPLIDWDGDGEADFLDIICGSNPKKQHFARQSSARAADSFEPVISHPWLENTSWKDRPYIQRCPKWEAREKFDELEKKPRTQEILKRIQILKLIVRNDYEKKMEENLRIEERTSEVLKKIIRKQDGSPQLLICSFEGVKQEEKLGPSSSVNQEVKVKPVVEIENNIDLKNMEGELDEQSSVKNGKNMENPAWISENKDQGTPPSTSPEEKTEIQSSTETNQVSMELKKQLEESKKEMEDMREMMKQLQQEVRGRDNTSKKKIQEPAKPIPAVTAESQKESAACPKCIRSSDARKAVQKDLDAKTNEANKLAKQLSAKDRKLKELKERYEGKVPRDVLEKEIEDLKNKYEGKKTREEMEKEMEEMKKVIEKLEEEKAQQAKLQEETYLKVKELNSMIDQLGQSNEQIVMRTSELESVILEKQEIIEIFKMQFPKEMLVNLGFKLPLEMKKVLVELQEKQDHILSQNPIGEKRNLVDRFISLTKNHDLKQRAEHAFLVYRGKFNVYEAKVSESIVLIQANPLIARAELPDVPELPDLPKEFYEELEKARNKQLDHECVICLKPKRWKDTWFRCPGCPKNFHKRCMNKWFLEKGERSCPHCRVLIPE